jgi:hypothetical protein
VNQQDYQAVDRPDVFEFIGPGPLGTPMSAPLTTGPAAGPRVETDRCRVERGAINPTDEGVPTSRAEEGAGNQEGMDAGQFAWAIRRLAVDARRALRYPEASDVELLELQRRSEGLLKAAPGSRETEICRWLRRAQRALVEARNTARDL